MYEEDDQNLREKLLKQRNGAAPGSPNDDSTWKQFNSDEAKLAVGDGSQIDYKFPSKHHLGEEHQEMKEYLDESKAALNRSEQDIDYARQRTFYDELQNELALNTFMAKHTFGIVKLRKKRDDLPEMSFYPEMLAKDDTYLQEKYELAKDSQKIKKIGPVQTFFALAKGYCCSGVLYTPKAYTSGGYLVSAILLFLSCCLTTYCSIKLVRAGIYTRIYNYSSIVKIALGQKAKVVLDVMLVVTQYTITLAQLTFVYESLTSFFLVVFNFALSDAEIGIILLVIFTALSWVRRIEKFSFAYIFGNFLLIITLVIICIFCFAMINERGGGPPSGFNKVNPTYWTMVGYSVFAFEGIGVVMPIMQTCSTPNKFGVILGICIFTMCALYITFSIICYYALGDQLTEPIILQEMPQDNFIIISVQLIFSVNLLCTYILTHYPVNSILESYLFHNMEQSFQRKWFKNTIRMFIVLSQIALALVFSGKLDKVLGLAGALFCSPLVFMFPTLCHLKLISKTRMDKITDITIFVLAAFLLVICTFQSLQNWNTDSFH